MSIILDSMAKIADLVPTRSSLVMNSIPAISEPKESLSGWSVNRVGISDVDGSLIPVSFNPSWNEAAWAKDLVLPAWMDDRGDKRRIRRKARKLMEISPNFPFLLHKLKRQARQK